MIIERCKVNGCTVEHPSDGTVRLFTYESFMRCNQCGASARTDKNVESIDERTHVCDICKEPVDVYEEAVKVTCSASASQGMDRVEIEVHPRCAVNAGALLMEKYASHQQPAIARGAWKPKWWDGLWQALGGERR